MAITLLTTDGIVVGATGENLEDTEKLIEWHDLLKENLPIEDFARKVLELEKDENSNTF
jgi:hypothetical protein